MVYGAHSRAVWERQHMGMSRDISFFLGRGEEDKNIEDFQPRESVLYKYCNGILTLLLWL